MLKVHALSKRFPDGPVLEGVSFVLNAGEKVGLVGPNGSGKSTLLRILAGRLHADSGTVVLGPNDRAGYLEQYPEEDLGRTVAAALAAANPEIAAARVELEASTAALAAAPPELQEAALAGYGATVERFERLDGYGVEGRAEAIADGLGLGEIAA